MADNIEQMWRHIAPQWLMEAKGSSVRYRLVWLNPSINPIPWIERLISAPPIPRSRETP
jgi:hypothetical protein